MRGAIERDCKVGEGIGGGRCVMDGNAKDCVMVEGWRKRKVWSEGRRGEERREEDL